ncbi:MAG: hypothetical protein CL920_20340 [Deltaproteobacteria bacterium]|nr:hypothetical protein [Deltaproteobacteria bacterium]MBU51042.1 hypothetical protein [Deltaproteobacteria bacterium]
MTSIYHGSYKEHTTQTLTWISIHQKITSLSHPPHTHLYTTQHQAFGLLHTERHLMKTLLKRLFVASVLLVMSVSWLLTRPVLYAKMKSPNGVYTAIAQHPLYLSLIPMMPGGGGGKAGYITIRHRSGRSCGTYSVPMVSFLMSIQWELAHQKASIPVVATWSLRSCSQ